MPVLLVIDDDPLILECFRLLFPKGQATVHTATSAAEGIKVYREKNPDVVVLDVQLPDLSGLDAYKQLHELDARVPVIFITGHAAAETAIDAMRLGAYEYVVKPLDPAPLRELITKAFEISRLMRVPAVVPEVGTNDESADSLVGGCPAMQEVYKAIGRVAQQDVTTLVLGESGTGKELVARAIYHYSNRSNGPFLAVNCAAIPENLLESELFGHEKGSFTGADRKRIGKFEQCNHGTLFLDEIGDMTPLTQAKVLRVLQDKQFERVGGSEQIRADVRIIAATNRNLEEMVAAEKFRNDLYYRLNVYSIKLPALKDRGDDLDLLASHFLKRFSHEMGKTIHSIADKARELLRSYAWPGNVRELQSVLKKAILQTTGPVLLADFLPEPVRSIDGQPTAAPVPRAEGNYPDLVEFIQKRILEGSNSLYGELQELTDRILFLQVLKKTDNNLTQAAEILGISRATLRNRLGSLGIAIERSTSVDDDLSK